jgi:hypothetical protein
MFDPGRRPVRANRSRRFVLRDRDPPEVAVPVERRVQGQAGRRADARGQCFANRPSTSARNTAHSCHVSQSNGLYRGAASPAAVLGSPRAILVIPAAARRGRTIAWDFWAETGSAVSAASENRGPMRSPPQSPRNPIPSGSPPVEVRGFVRGGHCRCIPPEIAESNLVGRGGRLMSRMRRRLPWAP